MNRNFCNNEPQNLKRKKDTAIELLRIIAILMVIGTHIKLAYLVDGNPVKIKLFIACLCADGVAIFWFILGCFYFKGNDYKKKVKNLVPRIIIPLFITSIVTFYFSGYLKGNVSFSESIHHSKIDYMNVIKEGLLKWNGETAIPSCGHLWYLYVYILLILVFPVINSFREFLETKKIKESVILIVITLLIFFNDLSFNGFFNFSHHTFTALIAVAFWVFIGYIVYKNMYIFRDNKYLGLFGLWLFLCVNIIRTIVMYYLFLKGYELYHPLYWYTSFAVLAVLGLIMFVFSFHSRLNNQKILSKIINHIGDKVFYIYLVHMLVVYFLRSKQVEKIILHSFHSSIIYQVLYTGLVFFVSLIIADIISILKKSIRVLVSKVKRKS